MHYRQRLRRNGGDRSLAVLGRHRADEQWIGPRRSNLPWLLSQSTPGEAAVFGFQEEGVSCDLTITMSSCS
jgi:hypothetical protein